MAAPDDTSLKNLINSNLPDSPPGQPRKITAAFMRATLFSLIDWVKSAITSSTYAWLRTGDNQPTGVQTDTIYHTGKVIAGRTADDGSGAILQAPSANFTTVNGLPAGQQFVITSVAEALPSIRYYAFAELATPTGGTYDFLHCTLIAKPWDNTSGNHLKLNLYAANRGGFTYRFTTEGDMDAVGIMAYKQADGKTVLYVRTDNAFRAISVIVHSHAQTIVYPTFNLVGAPTGTLALNTLDTASYKPLMAVKGRFTSFLATNSDGAFPNPISEAGSAQLSLAGNYTGGSSDLALINSNLAGGGISFWQQLTAASKRMLAYMTLNGDFILGTATSALGKLHVEGTIWLNGILRFPGVIARRKIVLYPGSENDHQFYGFGVEGSTLVYSVNSTTDKHAFYAGSSPATSTELMRIQGDGNVGIGTTGPSYKLDIAATAPGAGVVAQLLSTGNLGTMMQLQQAGIAVWRFGLVPGTDAFAIYGWNSGGFPERLRIDNAGRVLIGATASNPIDLFQVNGSITGKYTSSASNPSSTDLPDGFWRIQRNTNSGEVRMWVNVGGTVKSILFS